MYQPDPQWLSLGDGFSDPVDPARFPAHTLRFRNDRAAATVGLDGLSDEQWLAHFARFEPLAANLPGPLALRYHGHQFGIYNPDLGDGRGFLFAQLRDAEQRLLDLGTKGSGPTPWSRGGDGKLTLKGGVREILATEMLTALGVDTSQTFSLVETGEKLWRGDEPSPTRSCVMVRLSHSHVRFGSFQRLAHLRDDERLARLLEYAARNLVAVEPGEDGVAAAFLREVVRRKATTAAQWMVAGFVHGVLNTDNMNVTGESFDYGPYRFLPKYDPEFVAAYFDHGRLYRFRLQPDRVLWNLTRLAESLSRIADRAPLEAALTAFVPTFEAAVAAAACRRLGVVPRGDHADNALVDAVFGFAGTTELPFDRPWFDWYGGPAAEERALRSPYAAHYREAPGRALRAALAGYEPAHPDRLDAAILSRREPPTLVYDVIEAIWEDIDDGDDWRALHAHVARIRQLGALLAP